MVAVASYFASPLAPKGVLPRLQAALVVTDAKGNYTVDEVTTSTAWTTWAADKLYVPTGNAGISW